MTLFQKVYVSKRSLSFSKLCLGEILSACAQRNPEDGLTGLLLSETHYFFQVLEGPALPVAAAYGRIAADPRHTDCHVLLERAIPHRMFSDWSMAFREIDTIGSDEHCVELTRATVLNDLLHGADDTLRDLVTQFLDRRRAPNRGRVEWLERGPGGEGPQTAVA